MLQARRGPIRYDDYVLTRLLELVVHGDDLQRALGRTDAPLLPEAVDAVAAALAAAHDERVHGEEPSSTDAVRTDRRGLDWVRRAAGRVPDPDPLLPLL